MFRNLNSVSVIAIVVGASCSASSLAGIIVGPITNPANGHDYILLTTDNWTNSEAQAVALGGHLVTVDDQAEQDWVFDVFARAGGSGRAIWTGLRSLSDGAPFEWVSGDSSSYTHWAPGEPNFAAEHFVYMLPTLNSTPLAGFWNNDYDRSRATYTGSSYSIPQFDIFGVVELVPSPSTVPAVACLFVLTSRRRRYLP